MSYELVISDRADLQIQKLKKSGNKAVMKKLFSLLDEISQHPKEGAGQPELLKYELAGFWSRRINKEHRVIYSIDDEILIVDIVSVLGHYK